MEPTRRQQGRWFAEDPELNPGTISLLGVMHEISLYTYALGFVVYVNSSRPAHSPPLPR
jgi:hypothetical protein